MRYLPAAMLLLCSTALGEGFEQRYFTSVFSGDLSWAAAADVQTESGRALRERFVQRFITREEKPEDSIGDDDVDAIVRRYRSYWRDALLEPSSRRNAEERLRHDIAALIDYDREPHSAKELDSALANFLRQRGFNYRGGRTRPLIDLMLWRQTRSVEYDVELTTTKQAVTVHFLEQFLVRGWSHYATFGAAGTGGWADRDALYCIAEAYDIESEAFLNSYLRHEARHFADYRLYPELAGADLEYRAKLTELAFSSDPMALLRKFEQHGNGSSNAPHPLANRHIVNNLVVAAAPACEGHTLDCLVNVERQDIRGIARQLLDNHSAKLEDMGAEAVKATLQPIPAN